MPTLTITQSDANPGMYQFRLNYRNEHTHAHSVTISNEDLNFVNRLTGNSFQHLDRINIVPPPHYETCRQCGRFYKNSDLNKYRICYSCEAYLEGLESDAIGEY